MPFGAAGFCWGGKHALNLAHVPKDADTPLVNAVFTGHPSAVVFPSEFESIKQPVSIAIGDKDFVMPLPKVEEMTRVLETLDGVDTEVRVYPGAGHGFCVRAGLMDQEVEQHSKDAEDQAVAWFRQYLK
jgi:dienelactone hydrolase